MACTSITGPVVYHSLNQTAFTTGRPVVTLDALVKGLLAADVPSIVLCCYGMKHLVKQLNHLRAGRMTRATD